MNEPETDSNRDMKRQKQNGGAGAHLPAEQETNFCFGIPKTCAHYQQATLLGPSNKNCLADLGVFHFYPLLHHRNHDRYYFWLSQVLRELTFSNLALLAIPVSKTIRMSKSLVFSHYFRLPQIISMYPNVLLSQSIHIAAFVIHGFSAPSFHP